MASLGPHDVARIGYGAMQLTSHGARPPGREESIALLRHARALGVDHVDTAQFYGAGAANALIREALAPYDDGLVLATKVGADVDGDGALIPAQRPEQLRAQVHANLAALGTPRLGVVNLRRLDARPGIIASGDQLVDLDSQLAELTALRNEGLIDAIGLSNVSAGQIEQALPVGIACVQNAYSVLDRSAEPELALCAEHDVAWVPFCPLGSGFAGARKVAEDATVRDQAQRLGVTAAQLGLAWLLAHAPNLLLIAGTANRRHLEENLAAGQVVLDAEATAALQALGHRSSQP